MCGGYTGLHQSVIPSVLPFVLPKIRSHFSSQPFEVESSYLVYRMVMTSCLVGLRTGFVLFVFPYIHLPGIMPNDIKLLSFHLFLRPFARSCVHQFVCRRVPRFVSYFPHVSEFYVNVFIPRHTLVAGYYVFTLTVRVSVRLSVVRTSVRPHFVSAR